MSDTSSIYLNFFLSLALVRCKESGWVSGSVCEIWPYFRSCSTSSITVETNVQGKLGFREFMRDIKFILFNPIDSER